MRKTAFDLVGGWIGPDQHGRPQARQPGRRRLATKRVAGDVHEAPGQQLGDEQRTRKRVRPDGVRRSPRATEGGPKVGIRDVHGGVHASPSGGVEPPAPPTG